MINAETVRRSGAEIIENVLSEQILDAAIEVHRSLVDTELSPNPTQFSTDSLGGPGLLESLYEDALFYELRLPNIRALSHVLIPVTYTPSSCTDHFLRLLIYH